MSQPKQRQPRELLERIGHHLNYEWLYRAAPMPFREATKAAYLDIVRLLDTVPAPPFKRPNYYGIKGSLRTPHR